MQSAIELGAWSLLPWIPEPSTVNNKLKCRSGIQGRSLCEPDRITTTRDIF